MPSAQLLPRYTSQRDARLACGLSIFLPGLGQLYNQEPRKATFFMAAGAVNYMFVLLLLLMAPLMQMLKSFGESNQVRLNATLASSLAQLHAGSGAFFVLLALFLSFALFAARDAYDKAYFLQRKALYHDHVLGMPEATSGSYLLHISALISCFILAFFFLIPPVPKEQTTVFQFQESAENIKENPQAKKFSNHSSKAGGKHDPRRQPSVAEHGASAPQVAKAARQAKSQSKQEAKQETKPESKPLQAANFKPSHVAPIKFSPLPFSTSPPASAPVQPAPPLPTAQAAATPLDQPKPLAPPQLMPAVMANRPTSTAVPVTAPGASALIMPKINTGNAVTIAGSGATGPSGPVKIASASLPGTSSVMPLPVGSHSHNGSQGESGSASSPAPVKSTSSTPGSTSGQTARGPGAVSPVVHQGGHDQSPNYDEGKDKAAPEVKEVDFSAYMAALQSRIKRNWFPPKIGRSKRVKVIFNIARDGQLSKLRLASSSGVTESDQAALKAVEAAAPFMPLPKGAPADVDIEFTFDYNVFNGSGVPSGALRNY